MLITSRNPHWQDHATAMAVDAFARTESVGLLQARVPGLAEHDADRLAQQLEDLPLALVQAAALLADGLTLPQYLDLLQERISEVLDEGRPDTYPVSLAAQIRLSTQHLARTQPSALAVLQACALLAPEPFPLHTCTRPVTDPPPALAGLLGKPLAARTALRALAGQGLARIQDGTVQLHRLTQAVIRDQLTPPEHADAVRAAETLLTAAYPGDAADPATWPAWPALIPHLLTPDPADLTTDAGRNAAYEACWYLMDRGNTPTALPRLQQLHHTWTQQLGPDHQHTLWSATYLARAYDDTGDHAQARILDEDTLDRQRRVLGEDHPNTLNCANNLAIRLAALGELEAARTLAEDTLARQRGALGEDHPDTLSSTHNLAIWLAELGRTDEARVLAEDTLARRRRVLGENHPNTLNSAHTLAVQLAELGQTDEARTLGEDTLARRRRVLGENHPDTLNSAHNLAIDLAALGEVQAARALVEDTLHRRRRVLGEDHPNTLNSANQLEELRADESS